MAIYRPNSTTNYTSILKTNDIIEGQYTGREVPIILPTGTYQLECWGAQGGDGQQGDYSQEWRMSSTSKDFTMTSYSRGGIRMGSYTYGDTVNPSVYQVLIGTTSPSETINSGSLSSIPNGSTGSVRLTANVAGDFWFRTRLDCSQGTITQNGTSIFSESLTSGQYSSGGVMVSVSVGDTFIFTCKNTNNKTDSHFHIFIGQISFVDLTPTLTERIEGGYGGYSTGILTLTEPTQLYLCTGGKGASTIYSGKPFTAKTVNVGGWNGGGNAQVHYYISSINAPDNNRYRLESLTSAGGGGGASDIRIGSNSLYSRVIVAGGGGGASNNGDNTIKRGGGQEGASSISQYKATQTAAGYAGSFGIGGNAITTSNGMFGAGGGGGGWYGGGASPYTDTYSTSYRSYNGGGSGYVYTSSTVSNYPSGCTLNSTYYLTNASTTTDTHVGDGLIKITCLNIPKKEIMWIKINSTTWAPITNIFVKTDTSTWEGGII